jgi:hypothetical protein
MYRIEVAEKIKTRVLCSITGFPPENRAIYEIKLKNIVKPDRKQMAILYGARTPKATNIHTHNIQYLLFFHCNNGCKNAPE